MKGVRAAVIPLPYVFSLTQLAAGPTAHESLYEHLFGAADRGVKEWA